MSNYSGVIHFKITAVKNSNFGDIAIDNFEVRETPSCASPSGLTTSNVTIAQFNIAWTAGGSETAWNIEIGALFAVGTGSGTIANVTTNPFTIQNLSASTSYDVISKLTVEVVNSVLGWTRFYYNSMCSS